MILSNQVHCNHCGESPWSAHRHDFVYCACIEESHRVAVDGGMDYRRRVFGDKADFTDISIALPARHVDSLTAALGDKTKNDLGKLCNAVRYLRDVMDINVTQEEED